MWRNANKKIVAYWETVNSAAIEAVESGVETIGYGIKFFGDARSMNIKLPSGRQLVYTGARIHENRFGGSSIVYMGMNQTTRQWCAQETYGGKLVENIVQAIARDLLAESMLTLDKAGYPIVMHVHDEIVMEVPNGFGSLKEVNEIMSVNCPWAPGLPLKAESFETDYYKKD
jgi:DNA polymerase